MSRLVLSLWPDDDNSDDDGVIMPIDLDWRLFTFQKGVKRRRVLSQSLRQSLEAAVVVAAIGQCEPRFRDGQLGQAYDSDDSSGVVSRKLLLLATI